MLEKKSIPLRNKVVKATPDTLKSNLQAAVGVEQDGANNLTV